MTRPTTQGEQLAALEERATALDREVRDLKKVVGVIAADVRELLGYEHQRTGATKLGKFLAGTGFFGALGALALGFWHFMGGRL